MNHDSSFAAAQHDMRDAYLGGAPGIVVSGCVWLAAGVVAWQRPAWQAMYTLLGAGVLIHPVSVLLARALGRRGAHARGNPLGRLALETTIWMVMGMALALAVAQWRVALFFPAMLLTIGGRYLTFASLYGMRLYWLMGAVLAGAAWLLAMQGAAPAHSALAGAAIEIVFSAIVFGHMRRLHGVAPGPAIERGPAA